MIPGRKTVFQQMIPMLIDSSNQIVCDTGIKYILIFIGHHIDIICHNIYLISYIEEEIATSLRSSQ